MRKLNNPDMQDQLEYLLTEFAPLLESNPRSMKRLVNAYGVERDRLLRDGYLLTREERKQLALLVILRLRWPELADHLRRFPDDVRYCTDVSAQPHAEHPFRSLLVSDEVRRLFDGSEVGETLRPELMGNFPDRPPG